MILILVFLFYGTCYNSPARNNIPPYPSPLPPSTPPSPSPISPFPSLPFSLSRISPEICSSRYRRMCFAWSSVRTRNTRATMQKQHYFPHCPVPPPSLPPPPSEGLPISCHWPPKPPKGADYRPIRPTKRDPRRWRTPSAGSRPSRR